MAIRLGSIAPDFTQDSTIGAFNFHDYIVGSWAILLSHPKNLTAVCTTEVGAAARLQPEFAARGVKLIGLSVDSRGSHETWIDDIDRIYGARVTFPVIVDHTRKVSYLYEMIHEESLDAHTARSVFIIDPQKRIRAIIAYPAETGRNFTEILRVVDSLLLTDGKPLSTPADWQQATRS